MSELFGIITGLATSALTALSSMFTGNVVAELGTTNAVFVLMIFILFVLVIKKAMGMVVNLLIIGIASAAFPFAASYFGVSMPITPQTVVFFVVIGIASYVLLMIGKHILSIFGVFSKK